MTIPDECRRFQQVQAVQIACVRAFTLTELLVALAVVGALASLVSVAAMSAKSQARVVQCLGNVRQHGVALCAFLGEHGEYPLTGNAPRYRDRYPAHGTSWHTTLVPELLLITA